MAQTKRGKQWEDKFKQDWKKTFPGTLVYRLKDQMTGYKETSGNPCDFLCFPNNGKLYMVECKEHKGASIPFDAIPQYERLLEYKDYPNVCSGVMLWLSEKDIVLWISIHEMEKMYLNGEKSIGLRMLDESKYHNKYKLVKIPAKKLRVFMECDFTVMDKIV